MLRFRMLALGVMAGAFGASPVRSGGLDAAAPIGPFLDGALPARTPTAASGSWELVNAFPHLLVVDPVQMLPVPGSDLLMIGEKWGALMVFPNDPETDSRNVVLDLSDRVETSGDSGLLGFAFHPEFGQEESPHRHEVFVYYRHTPDPSETNRAYCRLSRFTWTGGTDPVDPASEEVLVNQYDRHNWHNGGGILFGGDGFLYLSIGDEGGTNDLFGATQRIDRGLFSGILRLDVDRDPERSHPIRRQPVDAEAPPPGWPASSTQGYFIPDDNPWQSPDGSALEEFWAIGARSPYRMTIDRPTGRIWVGDVGQTLEEEIYPVERGANYQWPFREGAQQGAVARPQNLIGEERPPLFRYGRGEGGCVIGGYVYRGTEHPTLHGKYLFGDFNNGVVRTLEERPGEAPLVEQIAELGDRQLISFGLDARDEIYLLTIGQTFLNGGIIHKLRRSGTTRPQPPATLSATGAFADLASLTPREGVMPYELVQPLWSDGAEKRRWIAIPNDGQPDTEDEQIVFSENGPWEFPSGTVLIKHFEFPGRRLETRFLVKGEDGRFFGFTYKWRPDHTDADLLPGPAVDELIALPDGGTLNWHFPGRIECFECHTAAAGVVLGPKTRHLHRDRFHPSTGRSANQLETWSDLGFFRNPPDPAALSGLLAAAAVGDETESLERRARSYLDINCSHCHLPGGPTQTGFDLRLTTPPNYQNLINVDPANGFDIAGSKLVKPGAPDLSILPFRMGSLDSCCAMPPIAKNAVDAEAVRVIARWIESLDPETSPAGATTEPPPADFSPPRVSLSPSGGEPQDGRFELAVTTSEPVLGLSASDFAVTNGTPLILTGSGNARTLAVLARHPGEVTVDLPSDRITDLDGNANRRLPAPGVFTIAFPAETANLLGNGNFGDGLELWHAGGASASASAAPSGGDEARLSGTGHLVQSLAVDPETNYLLAGWSRAANPGDTATAVVAFWDSGGRWIRERVFPLPSKSERDSFRLGVTSPAGAAAATLSILAPETGTTFVDELSFFAGGEGEAPAIPLTDNGDFERGLLFWEAVNDVTVSQNAHLGQGAGRVGPESSATFTRPVLPGTRLVFSGACLTEGTPDRAEAGLTFWSAAGEEIGGKAIPLPLTPDYVDFFFFADVPEGAVRLTLWVRNGPGGAVTVDDLGLLYVQDPTLPEPPGPDTGFEEGIPDSWQAGGPADRSGTPLSGTGAARMEPGSFFETSLPVAAGSDYRLAGYYRTPAKGGLHEAGITFRNRDGEVLGQQTLPLPPASAYTAFDLSARAPTGAVSLSAWIYNGTGGTLSLDDLSLGGTGTFPPAASGVNASTQVRIAGVRSRALLAARDPNLYSDPLHNRLQPDLEIRGNRGGFVGKGVFDATGGKQIGRSVAPRRAVRIVYGLSWWNAAPARTDSASLRGSRGNRAYSLSYFETRPAWRNCSAFVFTGRHRTPDAAPGGSVPYQIHLRRRRPVRSQRFDGRLTGASVLEPAARDAVRMRLR